MLKRRLSPASWLARWIEGQLRATPVGGQLGPGGRTSSPRPPGVELGTGDHYNRPDLALLARLARHNGRRPGPPWEARRRGLIIGTAGSNFALSVETLVRSLQLPEECRLIVAGGPQRRGEYEALASARVADGSASPVGSEDMVSFYRMCDTYLPTFYDSLLNAALGPEHTGRGWSLGRQRIERCFWAEVRPTRRTQPDWRAIRAALAAPPPGAWRWPEDVAAGLAPWLALVERALHTSNSPTERFDMERPIASLTGGQNTTSSPHPANWTPSNAAGTSTRRLELVLLAVFKPRSSPSRALPASGRDRGSGCVRLAARAPCWASMLPLGGLLPVPAPRPRNVSAAIRLPGNRAVRLPRLDLEDDLADAIFLVETIEHIPAADLSTALTEIRRVLNDPAAALSGHAHMTRTWPPTPWPARNAAASSTANST